MFRSVRATIAITIATLMGVTTGCGLAPNASVSLGANRIGQSQGAMAGTYSTRRVVVTYKSGGADRAKGALSRMGLRMVNDMPQLGLSVLSLPASANRTTVLASIAAQPDVASVEPDSRVRLNYRPQDPDLLVGRLSGEYDSFRSQLYRAWDITRGDRRLVVAVVDTGVDLTHPELRDHLVPGKNFVTQVETEDEEGNTQLVDLKDNGPMDDNGHGTHVAGIIAAGENQRGMTGIAPMVSIMPIKTLAYNESGFSSDVANGVIWAVDHGARVINMSLGAYGGSKALEKAVAYAHSKGAVVVAAMGNDRDDPDRNHGESPSYPAALPGVIAVGATDAADQAAYFSNAGRWISVSAPGDNIYSTTPTMPVRGGHVSQDYDYMSGTSMATPVVSGVIALMLSLTPNLTPAQVKSRLEQTADDVAVPGFDTATGRGRVNPYRALGGSN